LSSAIRRPRRKAAPVSPDQMSLFGDDDFARAVPVDARPQAPSPPPALPPAAPAHIPGLGDELPSGTIARIRANLDALALQQALAGADRPATADEQQALARWTGWGACSEIFAGDPGPAASEGRRRQYAALTPHRERLAGMLGKDGMAAAARSAINAHYTDPAYVRAMWDAVTALGFTGGAVLEPGCGTGNFIGAAPAGARMLGIELDPATAGIAAVLYPGADIRAGDFSETRLPDGSFDLVIGNVPFADITLRDPRHNAGRHVVHDHFIIKALHLLRPGGLLAVITSRYTLDKQNPAARREMSALADLAGAVRLPSGAHQKTAGTRVVTDVIILRRHVADPVKPQASWEQARPVQVDGREVHVNARFADYPHLVLGEMHTGSNGMRPGELSVTGSGDVAGDLHLALARIAASAPPALRWVPGETAATAVPATAADLPEGFIEREPGGQFTVIEDGCPVLLSVPATQAGEVDGLLGLRDAASALLDAQAGDAEDTPAMTGLRERLGRLYGAYAGAHGPLNRFGLRRTGRYTAHCEPCDLPVTMKKDGTREQDGSLLVTCPKCSMPAEAEPVMAQIRPAAVRLFSIDPYAPMVAALEDFDAEAQTATRMPIFDRRVISPRAPRLGADTPAEALAICMDTCGEPRIAEIAALLGCTPEQARDRLGDLVYDDPATRGLAPAAEYLSGKVRRKLRRARQAAGKNPLYDVNVRALTQVLPADLTPGEINARLGATWIGADDVQAFLRETLDDPGVRVGHPGGQIWAVSGNRHSVLATSTWGTERRPAPDLAQAILQQQQVQVHDTLLLPGGGEGHVLNLDETLAANEAATRLSDRFSEWVWEDPSRATRLAEVYNYLFNGICLRSYATEGAALTLPGLSALHLPGGAKSLHVHQREAIARGIAEPATLLAHSVGAGKTLEMAAIVSELKRLGLVSKAGVVVPNHLPDQFAREWMGAYPQARLLVARREDLASPAKRRQFIARCATGDWDAIIVPQSVFTRIGLTRRAQEEYMEAETGQLRAWLRNAKAGEDPMTVKRLEKAVWRAEERMEERLAAVTRDPGLTWEKTGIDYLVTDEAHLYKNLATASAIRDAEISGSVRASDLHMKLEHLRRRGLRRIACFATATPIANSITEAHVMLRYLRPDVLADAGCLVFDSWAATFGRQVTRVELAPEGGSAFRVKSRFAAFVNIPELMRMWFLFADVKLADDLKIPVPSIAARSEDGRRETANIVVLPSPELEEYVKALGRRADDVRTRLVQPDVDNMLKICGDGRRAAIDLEMVGLPQTTPGKLAYVADEVAALYLLHRGDAYEGSPVRGSLQIVFCDMGTPSDGRWNAYDTLLTELAARGVPQKTVRFIHGAKTDRDKVRLFAACRNGQVAVLVGSTEKMGVGVNVQPRCVALHHVDAPWRPADVEQRDGRAVRQGNLNAEVALYRYVTEGSFDAYMWQALARKARFIIQVMRGRFDVREMEDIGDAALSFAEVQAIATGNPLLLEKADADVELTRLERAERAWRRDQDGLRWTASMQESDIAAAQQRIEAIDTVIAARRPTAGDAFTMTVDGVACGKRTEAGAALKDFLLRELEGFRRVIMHGGKEHSVPAGELGGFTMRVDLYHDSYKYVDYVTLRLLDVPLGEVQFTAKELRAADQGGMITRLEHLLTRLEGSKANAEADILRAMREIAHARDGIGQPFTQAAALEAARERSAAIDAQIDQLARTTDKTSQPAAPAAAAA
jgi:N12 class adenine-specific DNA methylase